MVSEVFGEGSSSILASCGFILGYSQSVCADLQYETVSLATETVLISSFSSLAKVSIFESAAFSLPYLSLFLCYSSKESYDSDKLGVFSFNWGLSGCISNLQLMDLSSLPPPLISSYKVTLVFRKRSSLLASRVDDGSIFLDFVPLLWSVQSLSARCFKFTVCDRSYSLPISQPMSQYFFAEARNCSNFSKFSGESGSVLAYPVGENA